MTWDKFYSTEYKKVFWDNAKVTVTTDKDAGGLTVTWESVPTVEEQKEEIKAMNERIKKIHRQISLELFACGFILGALSATILYVLTGGYL
jgi:hypothetical protein